MQLPNKILSDIAVHMKYARYLPKKERRETWRELVNRNKKMHLKKYPDLKEEINRAYKYVYKKKVLPSMRSMQFGGKPIEVAPNRIYNCAYLPIDHLASFSECMFLLLGGTGVGYSVQRHHVEKLPEIQKPNSKRTRRFLIADSIEGWADAIKALMNSYFKGGSKIRFDYGAMHCEEFGTVTKIKNGIATINGWTRHVADIGFVEEINVSCIKMPGETSVNGSPIGVFVDE